MSGLIDRWNDFLIAPRTADHAAAQARHTPPARPGVLIPHGGRV
jgi:hypothetical protein